MMDRSGKERLIGAGILVALAVAVVPELLSGPKPMAPMAESPRLPVGAPDPVRNVTMDLATSKPTDPSSAAPASTASANTASASTAPANTASASAAPANTASASAAPTDTVPAPAADLAVSAPDSHTGAVQAEPMQAAPMQAAPMRAAPIEAAPLPAVATRGSGAGVSVQLGSFANRSNAEALVHQLKAQGYAVYESTEGTGKSARYRVRVGPFSDRDSAERSMAKLKASGHASTLIGSH